MADAQQTDADEKMEKAKQERRDFEKTFAFYSNDDEKKSKEDYIKEAKAMYAAHSDGNILSKLKPIDYEKDRIGSGYQTQGIFKCEWKDDKDDTLLSLKTYNIFDDWHIPSYQLKMISNEYNLMYDITNNYPCKNICKIYGGFIKDNGDCGILLERLNETVADLLKKEYDTWNNGNNNYKSTQLPPLKWINSLIGLANGINTLHKAGWVHRDLHLINILCRHNNNNVNNKDDNKQNENENENERVDFVLIDFGLALKTNENMKFQKGSAKHYGPESVNTYVYTTKNDVFAFGVMLYETIIGLKPLFGRKMDYNDELKLIEKHQMPDLDVIFQENKWNQQYKKVIQMCWNKDAAKRPDMSQVIKELEKIVQQYQAPVAAK